MAFKYIKIDCEKGKTEIPSSEYYIGAEGDNNARDLHYMVSNLPSKVDPKDCEVKAVFTNAKGEAGEIVIDDVLSDGVTMLVTVPVTSDLTAQCGDVLLGFCMEASDYEYHIAPSRYKVSRFVPGHKEPEEEIISGSN